MLSKHEIFEGKTVFQVQKAMEMASSIHIAVSGGRFNVDFALVNQRTLFFKEFHAFQFETFRDAVIVDANADAFAWHFLSAKRLALLHAEICRVGFHALQKILVPMVINDQIGIQILQCAVIQHVDRFDALGQ